jgi:hypothetical protein
MKEGKDYKMLTMLGKGYKLVGIHVSWHDWRACVDRDDKISKTIW